MYLLLGGKREGEKEEVRREVLVCQEESPLSEELHEHWCEAFVETRFGPSESAEEVMPLVGIATTERLKLRQAHGSSCRQGVGLASFFSWR